MNGIPYQVNDYVFVTDAIGELLGKVQRVQELPPQPGKHDRKYLVHISRNDRTAWFFADKLRPASLDDVQGMGTLKTVAKADTSRHSTLDFTIKAIRRELRKHDDHRGWQLKWIGSILTLSCSADHSPDFVSVMEAVALVESMTLDIKHGGSRGTQRHFSTNETFSVVVNWAY